MYLLALKLAEVRGTLSEETHSLLMAELRAIPHRMSELLESVEGQVQSIAEHLAKAGFFLFLGRHVGLPVCLEGALKIKEISYIASDAYAAGEMKHGPIALLD